MNNKKNTNEFKNIKNSEKVKKYKNINEIGDIKKKKNNKDINEFESIKEFYKKYVVIGFFVVGILGTLFHFVYDWSGQMWFVGLFVPVNESTWEHMKLLFVPMLIYIMLGNLYIKRQEFMQSKKYKEKNRSNNIKINRDIYGYNAEIVNDRQDKNNELHTHLSYPHHCRIHQSSCLYLVHPHSKIVHLAPKSHHDPKKQ